MGIASSWSVPPGAPGVREFTPLPIPFEVPTGTGLSHRRLKAPAGRSLRTR